MKKELILSICLLFLVACSSSSLPGDSTEEELVGKLPALKEIVTVENAQRALVLTQQIRVMARDGLALKIRADGVISEAELAQANTFDGYDKYFTDAWRIMDRGVTVWKLTGERSPDIDRAYSELLNAILKPNGLRDLPEEPNGE